MKEVVIVSACRTPIGSFNGSLKDIPVVELGRIVMEEVIRRGHIKADLVDEVLCGCVLQAAQGQNVARQAMLKAGFPFKIPAMTINKVCGSGLRVVSLAAQIIKSGDADCVIACGMESMSNAPYALAKARNGYRMGDGVLIDTMVNDGLCEVSENYHMGITAENINEEWKITREEQDEFALKSQQRAAAAISQGKFKDEIVPVIIKGKKSDIVFDTDEFPRATTIEAISKMKPAFKKEGLVTAANSSGINDGASAVLVMSREKSDELGIKPMARILSYANSGVEPRIMGIGPVSSTQVALAKAGLKVSDLDLIEANEAFAAQSIAVAKDMGWIDMEKVNVNGGAIALGHPIGASGNRILVSLLHEMQKQGSRYGLATLCIGGGMGTSLIVENFV